VELTTETAISRSGLQSIAPGPHYLQLTGLTAAGHPASPCLGEVYPTNTGEVRQFSCLNRVGSRVVRRSRIQV